MRNANDKIIGYKLIKEETDDTHTIEYVRDMLFFGMDDYALEYNGRKTNDDNYTIELKFATRGHVTEEREKQRLDNEKYWASKQKEEDI